MKIAIVGRIGIGKLLTIPLESGGIEIVKVVESGEINLDTNESIVDVLPIDLIKPKQAFKETTCANRNKSDRKRNRKERWR